MADDVLDERSEGKENRDTELTRRRFFQVTGVAACAIAAGGATALSIDFLHPRVLFEPPTRFRIGTPDTIRVGEVVINEEYKSYVVRQPAGFHAMSKVCTHLGCMTRYQPDEKIIACPCHGSLFSLDGDVIAGPAPRPLPWYEIGLSADGQIEVDIASIIKQGSVARL